MHTSSGVGSMKPHRDVTSKLSLKDKQFNKVNETGEFRQRENKAQRQELRFRGCLVRASPPPQR
jgi:hypothetical protein